MRRLIFSCLLISAVCYNFSCSSMNPTNITLDICEKTHFFIDSLHLTNNSYHEIALPIELNHLTSDSKVHVLKNDKSYIFLFKTNIEWKDNFSGILYSTIGFDDLPIRKISNGKSIISIEDFHLFQELYIQEKLDNYRIVVYFDLN